MTNPVLIPGKKLCQTSLHSSVSEAESQIPTPEKEINSDEDYCESTVVIDQLNITNKGIETFFVEKSEIEIFHFQLAVRYRTVDIIKGTRSNHSFVPMNEAQLLVSRVTDSTTTFIVTLGSKTIPLTLQNEQYVACTYGINWRIRNIVECYDEYNNYNMFMHPHGPSASYMWPKTLDVCWIPYEHITKIVSAPSISTGRTYKITPEENNSIEPFKNFKVD
ncbi:hypothetical protein AVEN_261247-1 [Araneus ventricosus]|uniref:Uncharacterized protein n=1 Tax=Araneus ventricosus TaxID=182803 RepID=A0A4Y2R309_ARAVE|nr:hypothetical protein AVEN_261247-1 [Araneus ventricosus]